MTKIITLNINGLRSGLRKGLAEWLQAESPDILCLQEIKIQAAEWSALSADYFADFSPVAAFAEKKGYSGVAILSRKPPLAVDLWPEADSLLRREGRFISASFTNFQVASLYLPSGSSGAARQAIKYQLLNEFERLSQHFPTNKPYIIAGDFNIARTPLDLKNWRANQKNSGFLPEERAWLSAWLASGWHDTFRQCYPENPGYTWWTYRGAAFAKDVGWRIDYQCGNAAAATGVKHAEVIKTPRFSDHAALLVQYDFEKN